MTDGTREVVVARKAREAEDISSFELVDIEGRPLPPFSAGSHVDVHVGGFVRQYSLFNDPSENHRYMIAVLREHASRGGSRAMHALAEGARIRVSDPKNHFPLTHEAKHHLLFAGGIGITPILCMAERLASVGASFALHYCTRIPQRTAFSERIARSRLADRVQHHHSEAVPPTRIDVPAVVAAAPEGSHLYVCGPSGFMNAVLGAARTAGWTDERMHREYFGADAVETAGDAFEVQIASTGAVIPVAAGQAVTAALAQAGIEVPTSCEQGVCGTCLTRVLAGTPEHRDLYLTPEEQAQGDQFTPCCSRARSTRLVLDL